MSLRPLQANGLKRLAATTTRGVSTIPAESISSMATLTPSTTQEIRPSPVTKGKRSRPHTPVSDEQTVVDARVVVDTYDSDGGSSLSSISGTDDNAKRTVVAVVKKRRVKKTTGVSVSTDPPKNWDIVYDRIRAYRQEHPAPVDTMGCERLGDRSSSDPKTFRFQTLVALMLSSQTRDTVTAPVMMKLREKGMTCETVLKWSDDELHECISPVGFHKRKTQYIKQTARILMDKYGGDIPDTLEGLLELPGVGPKMSFLALQCAWDKNAGIGVDVHVHRISNRLGWVTTKNPEDTRRELEGWLPLDKWKEVNFLMVGFGQTRCLPRYPRCDGCPVAELCPSRGCKV